MLGGIGLIVSACASSAKDSGARQRAECAGDVSVGSIAEFVDHLNTLPLPVTVPCVLESLARPFAVELTDNPISAQPANGPENPRIFLFSGNLVLTLVPEGAGAHVIELGEYEGEARSRKGEVAFPLHEPLSDDAPFTRIAHPEYGTSCAMCHIDQEPHPDGGMVSVAIRPEDRTLVSLDDLRRTADAQCGPEATSARCAFLRTLLAGEVVHQEFPSSYPTLFELAE